MNKRRTILLALVGLRATLGWAQLGLSEADCVRRWGTPTETRAAAESVRILAFSNTTATIEAGLVDGVVCRFVYDKPVLTEQDIQNLLSACTDDHQWSVWPSKQRTTSGTSARRWIRSDDAAMASVDGNTFTAVGSAWSPERVAAIRAIPEKQVSPPPSTTTNQTEQIATELKPVPALQSNAATTPVTVVKRPLPPTDLPVKGESRGGVVSRLGQPKGSLRMGDREIMTYDWGAVILHDGTVLEVQ